MLETVTELGALPRREIAKRLDMSLSGVDYWIRKIKPVPRREKTDPQIRETILRMHREGVNQRDIASSIGRSLSTVNYWINWREGGKPGRKRKTDPETDRAFYELSVQNPFMTATRIRTEVSEAVCAQTVRNRLREFGLRNYEAAKKERLTDMHKQNRLQFAYRHESWTASDWRKSVWFSDEKNFVNLGNGLRRVWRPEKRMRYDSEYVRAVPGQSTARISLWGCIRGDGSRILHMIDRETLNTDYYVERIMKIHLPLANRHEYVFVQDRSPIHMSIASCRYIDSNQISRMDWPSKAPDLNPIENMWAELERLTTERNFSIKNKLRMFDAAEEAFNSLSEEYVINLFESMPRRIRAVIEAKGEWTKY